MSALRFSAMSIAMRMASMPTSIPNRSQAALTMTITHPMPSAAAAAQARFWDRMARRYAAARIAYMNPYHYTVFSKAPGYRAFAREKGRKLVGIVVVAKDSPLHDLAELNGKAVVFPAPAAFAASILPRAEFDQKNIPIQAKYVNSHDSVYRGVAQGTFAAGGGIKRTLEALDPAISSRLRILASTPAYVPHAFAAHPRVDKALLDKVSAAFFSLNGDETGRQLLEPLSFKGIEAGQDKDWDEIRRLKINLPTGLPSNP